MNAQETRPLEVGALVEDKGRGADEVPRPLACFGIDETGDGQLFVANEQKVLARIYGSRQRPAGQGRAAGTSTSGLMC